MFEGVDVRNLSQVSSSSMLPAFSVFSYILVRSCIHRYTAASLKLHGTGQVKVKHMRTCQLLQDGPLSWSPSIHSFRRRAKRRTQLPNRNTHAQVGESNTLRIILDCQSSLEGCITCFKSELMP